MTSIVVRIAAKLAPAPKVCRFSKPWWNEECSRLGGIVGTFKGVEAEDQERVTARKLAIKEFHKAIRKAKREYTRKQVIECKNSIMMWKMWVKVSDKYRDKNNKHNNSTFISIPELPDGQIDLDHHQGALNQKIFKSSEVFTREAHRGQRNWFTREAAMTGEFKSFPNHHCWPELKDKEITEFITNLQTNKSVGPDGLCTKLIKFLWKNNEQWHKHIYHVYKKCVQFAYHPQA
ncbi:unnamed protein product [Ambrosiozyma monospora]|uniref:Unnamed protein product n=1 Tax=Ambrosiozyma monospora TaxID=43982 RepID=A0ACB5TE58_AMBMO|nr:unnamed protein product [Ambrosiozyma monospora]